MKSYILAHPDLVLDVRRAAPGGSGRREWYLRGPRRAAPRRRDRLVPTHSYVIRNGSHIITLRHTFFRRVRRIGHAPWSSRPRCPPPSDSSDAHDTDQRLPNFVVT